MKRLMASALLFEMALSAFAEGSSEKLAWWTESRFGMFIHFGLYATPARGEWVQARTPIAPKDYETYFEQFDPDLYDPVEWAKAAKAAGMKYVVLTAKHHEGFCLWDTKFTDYKVTNTSYGKDLLKPFVDAFRAEGLRVGFYYSLLDWHHPDYAIDANHPLHPKDDAEWNDAKAYVPLNASRDMAKYRASDGIRPHRHHVVRFFVSDASRHAEGARRLGFRGAPRDGALHPAVADR